MGYFGSWSRFWGGIKPIVSLFGEEWHMRKRSSTISLCGLQNDEAANKTTMAIIYLLLHRPWRDSTFVLHNLYQKKKSNNDVLLQRFIRTNFDFKITIIMRCGVEMFIYFWICSVFIGHWYALYSCQGNNIYDLSVHNNSCRWLQKYDCCKI